MAQAQPRRQDDLLQAQQGEYQEQEELEQEQEQEQAAAIRYGDVFAVSGDLAAQPISPRDAAAMRAAEDSVRAGAGVPQGGGLGFSTATVMETAAAYNQAVGALQPEQQQQGGVDTTVSVTQTAVPGGGGRVVVTELVAGQVVGQYSSSMVAVAPEEEETAAEKITIGEALEATARAGGGRPIDRADAEAIRAAEMSALGGGAADFDVAMAGGLGDQARAAARANSQATRGGDMVRLGDVLADATAKLAGGDRAARPEDAARVVEAETFNDAEASARAGGVGAAVATAARLNQDNDLWGSRHT